LETGAADIADHSTPQPPVRAGGLIAPSGRRWAIVASVLGLWQLGWAVDLIPPIGLPSPLEIAIALWQLIDSGELWIHLEATLPRLGLGWVLGAAIAVLLCLSSRRWPAAGALPSALATSAGSVPAIALMPLFMIWLGAGEASMIATTALAAFVPGLRAALAVADERPIPVFIETLHASLPFALAVLVAVEMIGGGFGLGALVFGAAELYRSDQIVAGCLVLAAIGLGPAAILRLVGRRLAGEARDGPESR
jgi:ABC-type nitrate/sulfonate/bicarbonate transport system permease component